MRAWAAFLTDIFIPALFWTVATMRLTDFIMSFLAFAVLTGFLGILVYFVPRADLAVAVSVTLALAGWDFFAKRQ